MLAQRSEKNSKRDEIGLFAEPVEVSQLKGEEVSVFDTRYEERQRFLSSSPMCADRHCYHSQRASGSTPGGKVNHIIFVLSLYYMDKNNNNFGRAQPFS